jgi:hypothetical protein
MVTTTRLDSSMYQATPQQYPSEEVIRLEANEGFIGNRGRA